MVLSSALDPTRRIRSTYLRRWTRRNPRVARSQNEGAFEGARGRALRLDPRESRLEVAPGARFRLEVVAAIGATVGGMPRPSQVPVALTIAGSDSGGGAGIQADLKTFASLGVHGACAITCITAQTPRSVRAVQQCRPRIVREQIAAAFEELKPRAIKCGMLYSRGIVLVVLEFFKRGPRPPLVVDPVMVASSGSMLLKPSAV